MCACTRQRSFRESILTLQHQPQMLRGEIPVTRKLGLVGGHLLTGHSGLCLAGRLELGRRGCK